VRTESWTLSPLWVAAIALIGLEEIGLWRLRARLGSHRARTWRWRGWLFDAALVAICLIDSSPLMGVSMSHLSVHMILHVVEMFYLPVALVLAGPFLPMLFAVPVVERRVVLTWWQLGRLRWFTRGISRFVTAPIVGLVFFNATMLFWHLPRFFNWASENPWADTWLMVPSFILAGYLFWRLMLPSGPYGPRASTRFQILAVVVTAFEMLLLAIAMGIMTHTAWYQMNIAMLGPSAAFADQQTAAGVLWVCGDFWVVPALIIIARRIIGDAGGVSQAFERVLGRV
jgi:cytochrome c oxidase assembly factor CtaG